MRRRSRRGAWVACGALLAAPRGCSDIEVLSAILRRGSPLACVGAYNALASRVIAAGEIDTDPAREGRDGMWNDPWSRCDDARRDEWPTAVRLWQILAPRDGEAFADLGAGGGYWTLRLARSVGPRGRVYATDTNRQLMRRLAWVSRQRATPQVTAVEVCPDAVGVPDGAVETALMVNVYRFARCNRDDRAYLARVWRALRPGGRFVVHNDFVHSASWLKEPDGCDQRAGAEVAAMSAGLFRLEHIEPVRFDAPLEPGESPGYVMVLRRVP